MPFFLSGVPAASSLREALSFFWASAQASQPLTLEVALFGCSMKASWPLPLGVAFFGCAWEGSSASSFSAVEPAAIRLGTLLPGLLFTPFLLRLDELVSPVEWALCPLFSDSHNLPFVV